MASKGEISCAIVLLVFFFTPLVSADIIINRQPADIYNLGGIITIGVTLKATTETTGTFQMDLICNQNNTNFYKNGIFLAHGEEKNIDASLILSKSVIGENIGVCQIKAFLGNVYALTNQFKISDTILVRSNFSQTTFNPNNNILIKGSAVKEDKSSANGFIDLSILNGKNTVLTKQGTVNNGQFSINATLPEDMKAGDYVLRLSVYEKDSSGGITNIGALDQSIHVNQVPTSLEIVFQNTEVQPGTNLSVKGVLYDQTGVKIGSTAFLTLKNSKDKIIDQVEVSTDKFFNFLVAYDEAPSTWKVFAISNKLNSESTFKILENEAASIDIINQKVLITNIGNVPYNRTVLVKIGNQSFNIDVYLGVGESGRWVLTAPNGKYNVQIVNDGKITGAVVTLTGSGIDVKKAPSDVLSLVRFPAVWIFILLILGSVAFIFFRKNHPENFVEYAGNPSLKKASEKAMIIPVSVNIYDPKSARAEIALSIKGDKQDVSMIALKIKNMTMLKGSKDEGLSEILKKIFYIAIDSKAATYEDNNNIFFIFAPIRTKTFKNEETALKVAQRIKEILDQHNRLARQKIDFGISLNHGAIIAKQEPDRFKFMGMGNLMTQSKKIASMAQNELLMEEKITEKLRTSVKTEKHRRENVDVYSIKEMKNPEKHEKFLKGFMKRMERDKS